MAKSQTLRCLLLLFFFIFIQSSLLSSARPLINDCLRQSVAAASEPDFNNIALPIDKVNASPVKDNRLVKPCDMEAGKRPDFGIPAASADYRLKIAGKYRPLILNVLPKGTTPPSGPSRGTNAVKN